MPRQDAEELSLIHIYDVGIIAVGAVVEDYFGDSYGLSFTARLPENLSSVCRLYMPYSCEVKVNGTAVKYTRDSSGQTIFFRFEGAPKGVRITARRSK